MEKFEIKRKSIIGINNPNLNVLIKIKNDVEFIIYEDNKKIEHNCRILSPDEVLITAGINKNSKIIEVYIVENNTNIKICEIKNNIFIRVINRLQNLCSRILKKCFRILFILYKGIRFFWKEYHFLVPISLWGKYFKDFLKKIKGGNYLLYNPMDKIDYNNWLQKKHHDDVSENFKYKPLISLLIPVYNIKKEYLSECLDSILNQTYDNFEVCLVDDCSTLEETKTTLEMYSNKDKRIKVKYRNKNGHISRTTNDALEMAKGEFVGLIDDDDLLTNNALYEVVKALNEDKKLDFIYSDEDKLDSKGRFCDPHFKPDFSPDTLLSLNYICHFTVIRKTLVEKVGGFTVGLEGAQDYDLFLKCTEKTKKIHHISKILYHWRMIEGSTAASMDNKSYAADKGKKALEKALDRRKIKGHIEKDEKSTYYKIVYEYTKEPKVSIIIPTRDYVNVLKPCIDSIYEKTTYKNFEVIIANNDSKEKETLDFFKSYKKKYKNLKVIDCIMDFNYSKINNIAVSKCSGDYVVLLNNDTEIITPEWLNIMVGYASQKHVGTVGAKLLYPDSTIQHAGVVLGLGGVASHVYIGASRDDTGIYGRLRVPYDYAANTAACIMISKKKFEEVNGLEENLKVAYNDIDFNIKLLKKGYYNVFLPQVELIHYESKSRGLDTTSEKYKRFLEESKYMYEKWPEIINKDPFYNENYSKNGWFMLDKK